MVSDGASEARRAFEQWSALLPGLTLRALEPRDARVPASAAATHEKEETGGDSRDTVAMIISALTRAGLDEALAEAVKARESVTIVVNDGHRYTDTRSFLDAFFVVLDRRGFDVPCRPRLLVAAGSHRSTVAERAAHEAEILGPHRRRFAAVAWHDARGGGGLERLGSVELHRWMGRGGLFVACGSVEPHYFAGATGAHKTLTVGVMSMDSLAENHEGAMSPASGGFRLRGNPVHEGVCRALGELEDAGARLFALNQIVVDGNVVACAAGPPLDALEQLLPRVRDIFSASLTEPVDLVIARVAPPLDRDLYQADKGIKNTEVAVRDGGVLVLEAECAGGVGIDHFVEFLRVAPSYQQACDIVAERGYRLGDHKAVALRRLTDARRVSLAVVSASLDASLEGPLDASIFADRISASVWILRKLGSPAGMQGLVVNDAGNLTLGLEPE